MLRKLLLYFHIILCLLLASCRSNTLALADAQLERGEYHAAQQNYRKAYNRLNNIPKNRSLRGEIARKLATCHARLNQPARASQMARSAMRHGVEDADLLLLLGQSLQKEGKYAEALKAFESYADITGDNRKVEAGIAGCRIAMEQDKPSRYRVRRAPGLNMQRSDYSPVFAGVDRDRIYFTTTNRYTTGTTPSGITGIKAGDVWMADRDEKGNWRRPEPAEGDLNTDNDEGVVSFSSDGMTMYITRARQEYDRAAGTEIWVSHRRDARWTAPERLHINGDSIGNYGHPAVSPDGRWLYFTSDRPGGSGGYDLWRVDIANGGEPLNLGNDINTAGNEMFPRVDDNQSLYFASDGHPGLGGLDMFRATADGTGWKVNHLPAPLNSPADDFGIICESECKGYFSSNRGDQRGYDHIYEYILPSLNIALTGNVADIDGYTVGGARIRIVGDDGSDRLKSVDNDGAFDFAITPGTSYAILASAEGYLNARQEFTADSAQEDVIYNVDFILAPVNRPVVVDNIFYDFDKASLRAESITALDSLATIMRANPTITIELSAHTDRKGSDRYNNRLSEQRAKAVVDYLTDVCDINPGRLSYKGYGKSRPMIITPRLAQLHHQFQEGTSLSSDFIESLEEESQRDLADQINRRTEFEITSVDFY